MSFSVLDTAKLLMLLGNLALRTAADLWVGKILSHNWPYPKPWGRLELVASYSLTIDSG